MKAHVQNPGTRSPQLFVHMSVEDARCVRAALEHYAHLRRATGQTPDQNVLNGVKDLQRVLDNAFQTALPHGLKGVDP